MGIDHLLHDEQPERLPPHNLEAEEAVLGSVLLDRSLVGRLADIIGPQDFYRDRNGTIWAAMLALHERHEPVDYLLLINEIERVHKLAQIGGTTYLAGLLGAVPTPIHAEYYANIVRHTAVMRRLISAGGKVSTLGFQNQNPDALAAVEESIALVQAVLPPRSGRGPTALKDALSAYLDYVDAVKSGDETVSTSVPSGMVEFDNMLGGGMQRSDLLIVGARPSMGKTSFCLNALANLATTHHGAGLMFSLEMPIDQIVGRLLSLASGIEATTIRRGVYTDVEVRRIGFAIDALADTAIYVDDEHDLTITQIRDRARRLHERVPLDLVIVDHLQLIRAAGNPDRQNRVEQLTEITRQLKNMARELRAPVLALSQLSRAVENRPSKIPELRDLRESGSSEQDADIVAFLYRDAYYHQESERQGITDVIVAKHRNGPTGKLELIFDEKTMRFLDIQPAY